MKENTIKLTLTDNEMSYLENALQDSLNSITGALESSSFDYERSQLEGQAAVLDVLIDEIKRTSCGGNYA